MLEEQQLLRNEERREDNKRLRRSKQVRRKSVLLWKTTGESFKEGYQKYKFKKKCKVSIENVH